MDYRGCQLIPQLLIESMRWMGKFPVTLNAISTGDKQYFIRTTDNDHIGTVDVKDATLPIITVVNTSSTTPAGLNAVFTLTSDIEPIDKSF